MYNIIAKNMPVSIPTALVARFVSTAPLSKRISALKTSYKIQYSGFAMFSLININFGKLTTLFPQHNGIFLL